MNPFPVVISSPSGGGKTTISRMLRERRGDVGYSISCTTRKPRDGEVHGRDYFFLSLEEFRDRLSRNEFAESATVHGHLYGTLRSEVVRVLAAGQHVLLDIDVQGARDFVAVYPDSVLIFLLPPSAEALLSRLTARRTESQEQFLRRVVGARDELLAVNSYHYIVVNDDLSRAYNTVSSIIDTELVRHARFPELDVRVRQLVSELDRQIATLTPVT